MFILDWHGFPNGKSIIRTSKTAKNKIKLPNDTSIFFNRYFEMVSFYLIRVQIYPNEIHCNGLKWWWDERNSFQIDSIAACELYNDGKSCYSPTRSGQARPIRQQFHFCRKTHKKNLAKKAKLKTGFEFNQLKAIFNLPKWEEKEWHQVHIYIIQIECKSKKIIIPFKGTFCNAIV